MIEPELSLYHYERPMANELDEMQDLVNAQEAHEQLSQTQQLFFRSNLITDGVWWHCGGPDLQSAIDGVKAYLQTDEETISIKDLEFDVRWMTASEVDAIPEC
jgi:hypothetical protein